MSILAKIRDKKLQGGVIYDPPPARIGHLYPRAISVVFKTSKSSRKSRKQILFKRKAGE